MKKTITYFFALCLVICSDIALATETHCKNDEPIIFNCHIENTSKFVSVCAVTHKGEDEQFLQYKFGRLGKAELVFPKKDQVKEGQFSNEMLYSRNAGIRSYNLEFSIDHNKYNVYWEELSKVDGEPMDKTEITSGVNVLTSSGKSIGLKCDENGLIENLESAYGYNVKQTDE